MKVIATVHKTHVTTANGKVQSKTTHSLAQLIANAINQKATK